ncbi:HTH-type transcriptional repressor RghR [Paenibacillus konkukensis]|uniref:HTH-type transcriptional repressor RghR n=1 Tax=Paenibacillus konkukensis TaxID=2020716 RepID=A0ABY4RXU8_9BACL|nr:helix-turn-helix transcriptional regulator [Paenibacillus konkukensis]UQZ87481.1 HTH-type transcriptional repressor RghR [Paenibacillus konkukensis]
MSEFGELLRQLRKQHKITQRRLAELVGIDFTYISKIESGSMDPPAEDKIVKIAEVLHVSADELILAADKVPSSFQRLITENKDVPMFLRKASNLSPAQWQQIKDIIGENDEEAQ